MCSLETLSLTSGYFRLALVNVPDVDLKWLQSFTSPSI